MVGESAYEAHRLEGEEGIAEYGVFHQKTHTEHSALAKQCENTG